MSMPLGLLTTSGVGTTAFQTDVMRTIRVSIGDLENSGVEPTAIVMNPTDYTAVELARDSTQRFLLDGAPTNKPPRTLWDLPVVTSPTMTAGKALVGDFRNVVVMDREAVNVVAFESGLLTETAPVQDLATRNMLKLRAELRAAPLVQLPAAFKVATLA